MDISQKEHHSTKRKRRAIAKCYRDNAKLREELQKQIRMVLKLRIKARRQEQKRKGAPDTPRTKTKNLLRNWSTEKGGGTRPKRRSMKIQLKNP